MNSKWFTTVTTITFLCLSGLAQIVAAQLTDPLINEFSASTTGADVEYVEVLGAPGTDYSNFTVLEIEGDSTTGRIDRTFPVGTTDGGGFWTTTVGSLGIENGSITLLLVEGFTGSIGDDIDADDDGVVDSAPWSRIVDDVAVFDSDGGDLTYSSVVLSAFYDGLAFSPGGASRIPNGTDTDTTADWVRNDFDLFGIPGFDGSPALGEAENTPDAVNKAITVETDPVGACGDPATLIHDIQGAGLASPDVGIIREIEGVVVGDFQGSAALNGFFVQEEDAEADADPITSEGIYAFDPANAVALDTGDVVRVRGSVVEFFGRTQLGSIISVEVCSSGGSASAASVSLPASPTDLEPFEGMAVTFPQMLYITEFFNFGRFGEIVLATDRQFQPTAVVEPGTPEQVALAQTHVLNRITLDDGRNGQNPDPARHPNGSTFDLSNLFRGGDYLMDVTGVLDYTFGDYLIQPTQGAPYSAQNIRTASPDDVGGTLLVASFNVLNYFTTLDVRGSGAKCGPNVDLGCRGADNAEEFTRQRDKIISAIVAMDADIVGLIEIENHPDDNAVIDLVSGLNDAAGTNTYAAIDTGPIGTDAIKVGFIYKPASVTPVGAYAVLDSSVDSTYNDEKNRPALAQTFAQNSTGEKFTAVVNHLKSKGSSCADIGDPNLDDGQANCNLTRTAAAASEAAWLATDPTGSGDTDFLIIGDLNAYDKEDPIDALGDAGYTDLLRLHLGEFAYSYVFDGQLGYLDHALANAALLNEITGVTVWHINADEPNLIDYDTSFKKPAQDALYAPDSYRSSDHDPVLIGLNLNGPECSNASPSAASLWPPKHQLHSVNVLGVTDSDGDAITITIDSIFQDEPVDALGDGSFSPDGEGVGTDTAKVRAERAGTGNGRVYHINFTADDGNGNFCSSTVQVDVPRSMKHGPVDDGPVFDSTVVAP